MFLCLFFSLFCCLSSCFKKNEQKKLPQPKAARRPVGQGILVQTKAAIDYLEMVESAVIEPQNNYRPLSHAIAAFYGWDDPKETPKPIYHFMRKFCLARIENRTKCGNVRTAANESRKALYEDALWVSKEMKRREIPWRDNHSVIEDLIQTLKTRVEKLPLRISKETARWPLNGLRKVEKCEMLTGKNVLLEIREGNVWVNGVEVTKLKDGEVPAEAMGSFQGFLVAGVDAASKGQDRTTVVIRVEGELPEKTLRHLFVLAAEVNIRDLALRVYKKGDFEYPCVLRVKLYGVLVPPPKKVVFLEREELVFYEGDNRKVLGKCNKEGDDEFKHENFKGMAGFVIKHTSWDCLIRAVAEATDNGKKTPANIWLGSPLVNEGKLDSGGANKGELLGIHRGGGFGIVHPNHRP